MPDSEDDEYDIRADGKPRDGAPEVGDLTFFCKFWSEYGGCNFRKLTGNLQFEKLFKLN